MDIFQVAGTCCAGAIDIMNFALCSGSQKAFHEEKDRETEVFQGKIVVASKAHAVEKEIEGANKIQ